ncbi:MAG: TRAP transporter substrate-binding protein [Desulforhopalus sp.]
MKRTGTLTILLLFIYFFLNCTSVLGAPKYVFKIASLAPAGSIWVDQIERFADDVKKNTGGEVGFRIYPGGVMGDDGAMYRKMRVGQLQGGGFTMTGISSVVHDFRVMATPFLFRSYEEVDYVKDGLLPIFTERFREKGLELIAMTEVGFLYAMSTKPIRTLQDQQNAANWSPAGDPMSEAFFKTLDITPVQLSISDVLSSLQSGLVDTVYNSLYGSIVLQWFTKARYITDMPFGYAYGVFALDSKKFAQLPESHRQAIYEAADTHFPELLKKTRASNEESRQVLKERGAEFLKVDTEMTAVLREKSNQTIERLIPDTLSQAIYDKTQELLSEYRGKTTAEKAN